MKLHFPLNPTTGLEDPTQLPWSDGIPQTGQEGSFPPSAAVVEPMTELANLLAQAGLTGTSADLFQVTRAIRGGQLDFDATDTGTADAVLCQIGLAHTQILAGLPFTFVKGPAGNTGNAVPTLTITDLSGNNGLTGSIVKAGGGALKAGDLPAGALITVRARAPGVFAVVSLLTISDLATSVASRTSPVYFLNGNYAVVAADQNKIFIYGGTTDATITLPVPNTLPDGWICTFTNNTGKNLFLTTPSPANQIQSVVTAQTQLIGTGQSITVASDGNVAYYLLGGNVSNKTVQVQPAGYSVQPTDKDRILVYQTASDTTWGLPAQGAIGPGWETTLTNNTNANKLTLITAGGAVIVMPPAAGTSVTIYPGQSIKLCWNGTNFYLDGGYYAPHATIGTSGYTIRSDGLIEQWGFVNSSGTAGSGVSVPFPLAFPNNVLAMSVLASGSTAASASAAANNTSFTFVSSVTNTGHFWRALGY